MRFCALYFFSRSPAVTFNRPRRSSSSFSSAVLGSFFSSFSGSARVRICPVNESVFLFSSTVNFLASWRALLILACNARNLSSVLAAAGVDPTAGFFLSLDASNSASNEGVSSNPVPRCVFCVLSFNNRSILLWRSRLGWCQFCPAILFCTIVRHVLSGPGNWVLGQMKLNSLKHKQPQHQHDKFICSSSERSATGTSLVLYCPRARRLMHRIYYDHRKMYSLNSRLVACSKTRTPSG